MNAFFIGLGEGIAKGLGFGFLGFRVCSGF